MYYFAPEIFINPVNYSSLSELKKSKELWIMRRQKEVKKEMPMLVEEDSEDDIDFLGELEEEQ